jgi:hypothetical protein
VAVHNLVVIIVVEGPSAAGKTTWCDRHAAQWLPEPGRWSIDVILDYQVNRWHRAVAADERGEVMVLDGDPFKLYYSWAQWQLGGISEEDWRGEVNRSRELFVSGGYGLADVVLYSDPGDVELLRRKQDDATRRRRNFELHGAMRPYFRSWYEAVAVLDPNRVIWEHPHEGVSPALLKIGRRPGRSDVETFDRLLGQLPA